MTTRITVELNDEEIEQICATQDLLVGIYNELVLDEKNNNESIKLLNVTQEKLDQIIYKFCNEHYRDTHY